MKMLQFTDKEIPYDSFVKDLSARIVNHLNNDRNDPEFISQRKAFQLFGRRNVERWRRECDVICYKRPGKVEYRTADLRLLQRIDNDYVDNKSDKSKKRSNKDKESTNK